MNTLKPWTGNNSIQKAASQFQSQGRGALTSRQKEFLKEISRRILQQAGEVTPEAREVFHEVEASLIRTGDIPNMGVISVTNVRTGRPGVIFFDLHLDVELSHEEKMVLVNFLPPLTEKSDCGSPGVPACRENSGVSRQLVEAPRDLPPALHNSACQLSGPAGFMIHQAWQFIYHYAVSKNLKEDIFLPLMEKIIVSLEKMDRFIIKSINEGIMPPPGPPPVMAPYNRKGLTVLMDRFLAEHERVEIEWQKTKGKKSIMIEAS